MTDAKPPQEAGPSPPREPAPTDEEALAAYLRGDAAMVSELVRRYERPLYAFLCRLTGRPADAADLFQETFLKVVQNAGSFAGRSQFKTWLYAIALNAYRSRARRATRRDVPLESVDLPMTPLIARPDGVAEQAEVGGRIADAVAGLPSEQREVFLMKVYDDMNYREIAEALGRPLGTVKSQMRLALVKMRVVLHDLGQAYGVS
jgi:RNA polymerase sigma-70 factor, ECF subfamily